MNRLQSLAQRAVLSAPPPLKPRLDLLDWECAAIEPGDELKQAGKCALLPSLRHVTRWEPLEVVALGMRAPARMAAVLATVAIVEMRA